MQFLPSSWQYQAVYLAYRWLLVVYFASWIVMFWTMTDSTPVAFIYLTKWAFITFNVYLLTAAISTTASYLSAHFVRPRGQRDFPGEGDLATSGNQPMGCCGYHGNTLRWYQMLHWLTFTIGNEPALVTTLLYWALVYRGEHVSAVSINVHLVNGLVAILDVWVSGIPINLLHIVYLMLYGISYVLFTGIYYVASESVIYEAILDYGEGVGVAVAVVLCSIGLLLPLVHVVCFYLPYLGRCWVVQCWLQRRCVEDQQQAVPGQVLGGPVLAAEEKVRGGPATTAPV